MRIRAIQAWLDSLPRQASPDLSQRLIGIFGTRQFRSIASRSTGSNNPFTGFGGLATLECLAKELPQEFQLAILRQNLVRRMCVDRVLGRSAPIVAEFEAEIDTVMKRDSNPPPSCPPATVQGDAVSKTSAKFLHEVLRATDSKLRHSTFDETESNMHESDDEVEIGTAFQMQFHDLAERLHFDSNEVLAKIRCRDASFHAHIMEYGRAEDLLLAVSRSAFGNRPIAAMLLVDAIKKFEARPEFGYQFLYSLSAMQGRKMALALTGSVDRRLAISCLPSVASCVLSMFHTPILTLIDSGRQGDDRPDIANVAKKALGQVEIEPAFSLAAEDLLGFAFHQGQKIDSGTIEQHEAIETAIAFGIERFMRACALCLGNS